MAYKYVGYFSNWAQYREGGGKFLPDQVDASLFTHINFAFSMFGFVSWSVDPDEERTGEQRYTGDYTMQPVEWNDQDELYPALQGLKQQNGSLKTLLSVGGWSFNTTDDTPESAGTKYPYGPYTSELFSKMAADAGSRAQFIKSSIDYAKKYGFDGIDLDWEYPAEPDRGGRAADYANFLSLLREFRQAAGSGFLLTIASPAVPKGSKTGDGFFQWLAECAQYLDWFNVMSYDYHGAFDDSGKVGTGANAPLLKDSEPGGTFFVKETVEAYLKANIPSEKIILGLATYGRSYTAKGASGGYGQPFSAAGTAGAATKTPGVLAYFEIVEKFSSGELDVKKWDEPTLTPYAYSTSTGLWVTYDNEKSLAYKVSYLIDKALGGAMVWAIDMDDFGQGSPLMSKIKEILDNPDSAPALPDGSDKDDSDEDDSDKDDSSLIGNLGLFPESWFAGASRSAASLAGSRALADQESLTDTAVTNNIFGAPAMAAYKDKLYCVYEGLTIGQDIKHDGWLWYSVFDGKEWSIRTKFRDHGTTGPPALAVYKGKLYCVHEGQDYSGWLWFCSFDGKEWSKDKKMSHGVGTKRKGYPSAALAVYNGLLYCVHEGQRDSSGEGWLWVCTFDGEEWSKDKRLPKHGTSGAPGLAVSGDKLACVFEGQNESGHMWYTLFDGEDWSKAKRFRLPEKRALGKRGLGKRGKGRIVDIIGTPSIGIFAAALYIVSNNGNSGGQVRSINNAGTENRTLVSGGSASERSPMSTPLPPAMARFNGDVYIARNASDVGIGQLVVAAGAPSEVAEEDEGLGTFEIQPQHGTRTTYTSYLEWIDAMRSSNREVAVRFEINGAQSPWIRIRQRDFYVTAFSNETNPWANGAWRDIPANQINYGTNSINISLQSIRDAMFRVGRWAGNPTGGILGDGPLTILIFLSAEAARFDGVAFAVNALLRGQVTNYDWLNFRTLLTNWSYISENIYNLPRGGLQTGVSLFIARALAGSSRRGNQQLFDYLNELADLGYLLGFRGGR